MKKYSFKTNINCGGCVAKVTPYLNGNSNIIRWEADTANPDKILTIEAEDLSEEDLKQLLAQAGFKAESIVNK